MSGVMTQLAVSGAKSGGQPLLQRRVQALSRPQLYLDYPSNGFAGGTNYFPWIVGIAALGAVGAGVWYFYLR